MKNKIKTAISVGILAGALVLLGMANQANASVNTLTLQEQIRTDDGSLCIYSDGNRTETYEKDGAGACPTRKTFH